MYLVNYQHFQWLGTFGLISAAWQWQLSCGFETEVKYIIEVRAQWVLLLGKQCVQPCKKDTNQTKSNLFFILFFLFF